MNRWNNNEGFYNLYLIPLCLAESSHFAGLTERHVCPDVQLLYNIVNKRIYVAFIGGINIEDSHDLILYKWNSTQDLYNSFSSDLSSMDNDDIDDMEDSEIDDNDSNIDDIDIDTTDDSDIDDNDINVVVDNDADET